METFKTAFDAHLGGIMIDVQMAQMEMLNTQYSVVAPALAKNVAATAEDLAELSKAELIALAGKDGKGTDPNCFLYKILHTTGDALTKAQQEYNVEQRKWENMIQAKQASLQGGTQTLQAHTQALEVYTQMGKALNDVLSYLAQNTVRG